MLVDDARKGSIGHHAALLSVLQQLVALGCALDVAQAAAPEGEGDAGADLIVVRIFDEARAICDRSPGARQMMEHALAARQFDDCEVAQAAAAEGD